MDHLRSPKHRNFDLCLRGTSIQTAGTTSSRPSSARRDSESKKSAAPSREGSPKEPKTTLNTSITLSSARQRRHSNNAQRSLWITSPPLDSKKSSPTSTSSSAFRVISPPTPDVETFFTDQSHTKSLLLKRDGEDDEWDERRSWVDELHQLNSVFTPEQQQQQNQSIGPLGMSRDSLNGTVTNTHFSQTNHNQLEKPVPSSKSANPERVAPTEVDSKTEDATVTIQRWYRKNRTKPERRSFASVEQIKPIEDQQTPTRIRSHRVNQEQEINRSRLSSRRSSSASSTPRHRTTPIPSSRPPSARTAEKIPSASSVTSSTASKVTLDDVYETLRKLEEVEQFPTQSPLENDSVYLIDPTIAIPPPFIDNLPTETNAYDRLVENVRSQKFSERNTNLSSSLIRPGTPPRSARRPQATQLTQSVSIPPQSRSSPSVIQQTRFGTKLTTPYKSLMTAVDPTTPREEQLSTEKSRTTQETKPLELNVRHTKDFDHQLQIQKDDYEAIIQRHLKFIDELIEDKRKLSDRCEHLTTHLKTIDKKCNDRIRSVEDSQLNELQKLKDVHEAAEKLRRERWIEEKTKKIKELTVRGLEPEIQNLISKNKAELTKMKTIHQAELLAADERASQRYIRMVEELRDQLEREKEVAIAKERELAREKYEKSLRDEERSFSEQRRRLYTEIEEEKNRQADVAAKQRADLDKLRHDIEENHRTVADSTKREYEGIRLEQERRHTSEVEELKEKLTLEKRNWEENLLKQQETVLANKERELREHMKQERDREIEKIIAKLESDTTSIKEETERTAEDRVKRIRDKYEADLDELGNSEKQTKERFNQIRAQMTDIQGEHERLQVQFKQKESEINDIKKITDTLQQERQRLSEIIRQEFADRLVSTEEENRRVKGEIAELRARQQLELEKKKEEVEAFQRQHDQQLETINEKIKQAIKNKDQQVHALRVEYESAVKRVEHLQGLLSQQRKLLSTTSSTANRATKKAHPS